MKNNIEKLKKLNKMLKIIKISLITLLFFVTTSFNPSNTTSLYAAGPPSPGRRPPPPKLPIDDYIGIAIILSILYGFYVISYKLKAKTPR